MIPVQRKDEPDNFEADVRRPGHNWLTNHGINLQDSPPDPSKLPTYWRETQKQLYDAYEGTCAYLAIYFPWPIGAQSTDHFVAKSRKAGDAYEWSNYRLACIAMNRNKNAYDDVLDPFEIVADTFTLVITSGEIKANKILPAHDNEAAVATITRLKLDDPETNRMRASHWDDYANGDVSEAFLKKNSPFVWYEAKRQGFI